MPPRLVSAAALALPLLAPQPLRAQVDLPRVRISDVQSAIRVVEAVRDIAGRVDAARSGRSGRGRVERGGAGSGGVSGVVVSSSARGHAAVVTGSRYLGVPYVWGGETPDGFDCSGFVQYVYRKHGVPLPRTSRQMAHAGQRVTPSLRSLREGDLMLFRGKNGVISHVALYAGRDRILHSSSSGHGVRFDELWSKRGAYYRSHLVAARRVAGNGKALIQQLERIYLDVPFDHFDPPDDAPSPGR